LSTSLLSKHAKIKIYKSIILPSEELHDLYTSPNFIRVIKSRMRWVEHVARMGKAEVHTGFWLGDMREGDHLQDPGVDERIILKWIFKKRDGGLDWIDLVQDRNRWRALVNVVTKLSASIKCGEFLDWLRTC
jgi:hypothetical protein